MREMLVKDRDFERCLRLLPQRQASLDNRSEFALAQSHEATKIMGLDGSGSGYDRRPRQAFRDRLHGDSLGDIGVEVVVEGDGRMCSAESSVSETADEIARDAVSTFRW